MIHLGPDDLILTEEDINHDEQVKEEGNDSGDEQDGPKPGPSRYILESFKFAIYKADSYCYPKILSNAMKVRYKMVITLLYN